MYDARWVETLGGPIEENVALLRRLRAAGRPVHALSNYSTAKFAVSEDLHAFLREFDTRVVSGHVGVAKPDPRIYKILIERAGASRTNSCSSTIRSPTSARPRRLAWRDSLSARRRPRSRAESAGSGGLSGPERGLPCRAEPDGRLAGRLRRDPPPQIEPGGMKAQ